MKKMIVTMSVLSLCISACSTPYVSNNDNWLNTGGYGDKEGPGGMQYVAFRGNGYTSPKKASDYALLRAAEVGMKKEKPYFALYTTLAAAFNERKSLKPALINFDDKPYAYFFAEYHTYQMPGDFSAKEIINNTKK